MNSYKTEILKNICFTELVYGRINKKLNKKFSKNEIQNLIYEILKETEVPHFQKIGKNIYVTNGQRNIRITVNSNTFRIITVDEINKAQSRAR